ncbi:hypothetical protein KCU71_g2384, partial [Aureobasidium melanogenum]
MSTTNKSVWQDKAGIPGTIRETPVPSNIADNEILVKAHAWGLNPADHMVQDFPLPFISYPLILGEDVAGTVEWVGSAAASVFKKGDRVLALALGAAVMKSEQGGFQEYVVHDHTLACKIPDAVSFAEAAVFPLCLATAAHGLFSKDYLGLPFPTLNSSSNGKSILIWGGSSGVGSNAIQLCKHAGFEVVTTCSAGNFDYVKSIGADKAFDHSSPSVIEDVVTELDKGVCGGILQAAGQVKPSAQVAHKSKQKLFVASSNPVGEGDVPEGVEAKMIFATGGAVIYYETNPATFGGFMAEALANGVYKVAPSPEVVKTKGVEGIQEGLDILKKGVSAKKIVVEAD